MSQDLRASPFGAMQGGRHWLVRLYDLITLPFTIHFVLSSPRVHPDYKLTTWRRLRIGWRIYRNTRRVWTGVSYRAHLAMAVKLFEIPPGQPGVVVECGCFRGGTSANLALMCEVVGRELYIYDSFEGLPPAREGDQYGQPEGAGFLSASLEQVRAHVEANGSAGRTTYVKGWFEDTTPHHEAPIVMMFLDVDYQASLTDCIVNLWPKLTEHGYCFIDEFMLNDYCALFWSERFWSTNFDRTPPGLTGSGTGISVGGFYLGGPGGLSKDSDYLNPDSVAYTRKHWSGYWGYYPARPPAVASEAGGRTDG